MYVTPARCEQIDFSEPTYCIGEAFIVKEGNPLDLHSYEDVAQHSTARLGVVAGTVELGYARSMGIPEDRVSIFPDAASAVEGLQADRMDAYAGTSTTVQNFLTVAGEAAGIRSLTASRCAVAAPLAFAKRTSFFGRSSTQS